MNTEHVDDLIEFFALGMLERADAERVDRHAAICARCSRELGAAEAVVAGLEDRTTPQLDAPSALGRRLRASAASSRPAPAVLAAFAACLLAVVLGAAGLRDLLASRGTVARDDAALAVLVTSHFVHRSFTPTSPNAPAAKVLLGRSPHWLYVIVATPDCGCRVVATTPRGVRDLGAPEPHGRTSTLFLPGETASRLELRAGDRTIASVAF